VIKTPPESFTQFKKKLDAVSPSFCLAKWKQVTIHLQTGHTHSCHHPTSHKIPIRELRENPSALHNTEFKKKQRELMLKGIRPKECGYCWTMEDAAQGDLLSDRVFKSSQTWAVDSFQEIATLPFDTNILPSYVEVSFSNICNFKCSYCSPHSSSSWHEEVRRHGPYLTSDHFNNLPYLRWVGRLPKRTMVQNETTNPHLAAWRKWWPELSPKLKVFRITGGEPLLSKETFRVLENIREKPLPSLELGFNSNLCVPEKIFSRFLMLAKELSDSGKVKALTVFASIDTFGEQAEYIRFGLDHRQFFRNVDRLLETCPNIQVVIMCTFNALSPFQFKKLLQHIEESKKRYKTTNHPEKSRLTLDISYLRSPPHQALPVLGGRFNHLLKESYDFMIAQPTFGEIELEKMRRLLVWAQETAQATDQDVARKDLMIFVAEHDRRRGTDFLKTFPELKEFCEEYGLQSFAKPSWRRAARKAFHKSLGWIASL
jgi:organic radical activating enzyme